MLLLLLFHLIESYLIHWHLFKQKRKHDEGQKPKSPCTSVQLITYRWTATGLIQLNRAKFVVGIMEGCLLATKPQEVEGQNLRAPKTTSSINISTKAQSSQLSRKNDEGRTRVYRKWKARSPSIVKGTENTLVFSSSVMS